MRGSAAYALWPLPDSNRDVSFKTEDFKSPAFAISPRGPKSVSSTLAPSEGQSRTMTQVPAPREECQPSGSAGVVQSKSLRASSGARATPGPVLGAPQAVVHHPANKANGVGAS